MQPHAVSSCKRFLVNLKDLVQEDHALLSVILGIEPGGEVQVGAKQDLLCLLVPDENIRTHSRRDVCAKSAKSQSVIMCETHDT